MLTKKQKESIVKELSKNIKESKTAVICDYKGMTVPEIGELREGLRKNNASMEVTKKTLMKVALKDAKVDLDPREMEGQLAIVHGGDDEVSSPKTLHEYAKENEKLKILAGVLEGNPLSAEEVKNLAKLPSKEELLGKVVGTIKAPVSGFVNVLSGNLRNLVYALNAVKEAKEGAEK